MIPVSLQVLVAVVLVAAALFDSIRAEVRADRERRMSAAATARILAYVKGGNRV